MVGPSQDLLPPLTRQFAGDLQFHGMEWEEGSFEYEEIADSSEEGETDSDSDSDTDMEEMDVDDFDDIFASTPIS